MAKRVAIWIVGPVALGAAVMAIGGPEFRAGAEARAVIALSDATHHIEIWSAAVTRAALKAADRNPAAAIAIAFGLALPVIGLVAWLVRTIVGRTGRLLRRIGQEPDREPRTAPLPSARSGWLEVERPAPRRVSLTTELHRIGRDADSDTRVTGPHIAATHALIRRTPEREFHLIDVSGEASPIVEVNGQPCRRTALRDGDRIAVGGTSLVFRDGRAPPAVAAARCDR